MGQNGTEDIKVCASKDQEKNAEVKKSAANGINLSLSPRDGTVTSDDKLEPQRDTKGITADQNDTSTSPIEESATDESQSAKRKRQDENENTASAKPKQTAKLHVLDFTWICTECNEAECDADPNAELMICEGGCHRPFHYPCANLSSMPDPDEDWACEDCQKKRHRCELCDEYGIDNEEVFCCDKEECGLFFHESCLSMQNVEIIFTENMATTISDEQVMDGEPTNAGKPHFICPAHSCWACTEDIIPVDEEEEDEKPIKKKKGKGRKKTKKNQVSSSFAMKRDPNLYVSLLCRRGH
jgi:hypothetical protein